MNMLVGGGALLIACAAFVAYELATLRSTMVQNLSLQAQIAGELRFLHPVRRSELRDYHSRLQRGPAYSFAGVYTPYGSCSRTTGAMAASSHRRSGRSDRAAPLTSQSLTLTRPILLQGKLVGLIYLVSNGGKRVSGSRSTDKSSRKYC